MTVLYHLTLTPIQDETLEEEPVEEQQPAEPSPAVVFKEEYMDPEENQRQEMFAKFIAEVAKRQDFQMPKEPFSKDIVEGKKIIFGRNARIIMEEGADANFVNLNFPEMSRKHAQLKVSGEALMVKDLGSANGTFLNGKRLSPPYQKSKSYPMQNGDILIFGKPRPNKKDPKATRKYVEFQVSMTFEKFKRPSLLQSIQEKILGTPIRSEVPVHEPLPLTTDKEAEATGSASGISRDNLLVGHFPKKHILFGDREQAPYRGRRFTISLH